MNSQVPCNKSPHFLLPSPAPFHSVSAHGSCSHVSGTVSVLLGPACVTERDALTVLEAGVRISFPFKAETCSVVCVGRTFFTRPSAGRCLGTSGAVTVRTGAVSGAVLVPRTLPPASRSVSRRETAGLHRKPVQLFLFLHACLHLSFFPVLYGTHPNGCE